MNLITIILIAVAVSMDSFAISLSNGLTIRKLKGREVFIISFTLAFFHAAMILTGWYLGLAIDVYIEKYDHWIAFVILLIIGFKMIYEALFKKTHEKELKLSFVTLLWQALASSIDALALGISFALLKLSILKIVLIIGMINFLISIAGLELGRYYGKKSGKSVEIFGGIILILIGIKILIEHTFLN